MKLVKTKPLKTENRYTRQNATLAIRDIFDVIVELVTNCDDRYQLLGIDGAIDIEVERRQGTAASRISIRDHADGMTSEIMEAKIGRLGGRVSGMEEGHAVRGTNSRGAKDIAALGDVTFESIAEDGRLHSCKIDKFFDFHLFQSERVTPGTRKRLKLPKGTGTVVTLSFDSVGGRIPRHDNLCREVSQLVSLRDVLSNPKRTVRIHDLGQSRVDQIRSPRLSGEERVKSTFEIPGYKGATAKLIIKRAAKRFERGTDRFRLGGIVVKSGHAIHESTLFDSELERDPHAAWFFGRLNCEYLDTLWNEFDDRYEARLEPLATNPLPIIDPSRQSGLTRAHPFVQALYAEARKRLRPLVEEERRREEGQRSKVESDATRRRLNNLEKAAAKFIREFVDEPDVSRDPTGNQFGSTFQKRGFSLMPPFAQLLVGHSQRMAINIRQESFPELELGSAVQIDCLSNELESSASVVGLDKHPTEDGVLRAVWTVKAVKPTLATGVRVRVGPISAETTFEVLETEKDRYWGVDSFRFERKKYRVTANAKKRKKKIRLVAPIVLVGTSTPVQIECSNSHFEILGTAQISPNDRFGVSVCDVIVQSDGIEAVGKLTAQVDGMAATCEIHASQPPGADLKIEIEDIDLGNQRSRWRKNVLEIAARHPSLKRYLGRKEDGFPGQEDKHFRVLVAEIVSEAVCAQVVGRNVESSPEEYEDADWDQYYAEYTRYMTAFLPIAHKLQFAI